MSTNPLPCVAGVAHITDKAGTEFSTPSEFFSALVLRAIEDAGLSASQIAPHLTDCVTVRMQPENMGVQYHNLAYEVCRRTELLSSSSSSQKTRFYHTSNGGDTPQKLVNKFAHQIAMGESRAVLIVGGELLDTFLKLAKKTQSMPEWGNEHEELQGSSKGMPAASVPLGNFTAEVNDMERRNGLTMPKEMYAMMDQASRAESRSFSAAFEENARLFDALNLVASQQPGGVSWFPTRRTAEDIASTAGTRQNRWVAFPYPKYMNSVIQVNQGACVLLLPHNLFNQPTPSKPLIYVRGCGECVEPGFCVSERPKMYTSYGMKASIDAALEHAGVRDAKHEISEFDLYSCFPIAVRVAKEHLQLDDYTKLTVTGGLPFYGGAGNAYTLCSIAHMVETLRRKGTQPPALGLVNGNGWFMTKHSCGVYGNTPPASGKWRAPEDASLVQQRADKAAGPLVQLDDAPNGEASIEAYIVDHAVSKKQPNGRVVVFGRLAQSNKRFLACNASQEYVDRFMQREAYGAAITVTTPANGKGPSTFTILGDDWDKLPALQLPAATKASSL